MVQISRYRVTSVRSRDGIDVVSWIRSDSILAFSLAPRSISLAVRELDQYRRPPRSLVRNGKRSGVSSRVLVRVPDSAG